MQSLDNQYEYWDKVSSEKNFTHTIDLGILKQHLPLESDILDYGCGYGRICNELQKSGYENILGVDSSEKMIERGVREYPSVNLELVTEGVFESNKYDAVILAAVLTCIPSNEGQRDIVRKLLHTMKPNGIIYVSDYWLQSDERNLKRYRKYEQKYGEYGIFELPDGAIVRHHDKKWISQLLAGFQSIYFFDCTLLSMNGNESSCFQYFGRKK